MSLNTLLNSFEQFLQDLKDEGVRTVPCSAALPPPPDIPAAVTPSRQTPSEPASSRPAPVKPVPSKSAPVEPAPAQPRAASTPETESGLVMVQMERLPECLENHAPEQTSVLLVLEKQEIASAESRELLQSMLHAIGYALPEQTQPLTDLSECPRDAARILCMGEKANELFCTLNMGLNLVRGKWQSTSGGRMLATYPPSYLLNNPTGKRAAWNDLQKLLEDLGLSVPEWTRKKLSK